MADAPISEELATLRKRARRRLVGAIALVAVALVVLWTVMDDQPPPGLVNTPVTIVSEKPNLAGPVPGLGPAGSATRLPEPPKSIAPVPAVDLPASQPAPPTAPPAADPSPLPQASPAPVTKPTVAVDAPASASPKPITPIPHETAKPAPAARDPQRILEGADPPSAAAVPKADSTRILLQVGAFADAAKVAALKEKITAAGLPLLADQVSTAKGELTRIRVGPFAERGAADKAHASLAGLGIPSQIVGK